MRSIPTLSLLLVSSLPACASQINIGVLSFDFFSGGVNSFNILNLTGDPTAGGLSLPPDLPVFTSLAFLNSDLTVVIGGISQTISLGDIGPGSPNLPALQFPDATIFDSAVFSATLSSTNLLLFDNTSVQVNPSLSIVLLPSVGTSLTPGDLALIAASTGATTVPEPATSLLCGTVAVLLLYVRKKRAR